MDPMPPEVAREIRGSLAASRGEAERILAGAEARARALSELAGEADRRFARARIERLETLRDEIEAHQERIELAYVAMVEALAAAASRLTEIAREADFSAPSWPDDIRAVLEVKLTETREITIRLAGQESSSARRSQTF